LTDDVKELALQARHETLGARFATFAGFNMPLRYGSILSEHNAVRKGVGLFDVSHMGEVAFRGPGARAVLDRIVTNDVSKLRDGHALYTVMCHPNGGIVDDLLIYRLSEHHYLACVNASNRAKDFAHMRDVAAGQCDVIDRSDDYVQLALQGPRAEAVLSTLTDLDVASLGSFRFAIGDVAGVETIVSRTGYTGEDGYELYYPTESAAIVFDALLEAGQADEIRMIGLAARDTLRLEARLMLYGNDITDTTSPLEAGLRWVVKLDKGDFVGRDALLAQREAGLTRRLRGLVLDGRGVLRSHYPIFAGDVQVGETTSGGPGPTVGKSIALGYVSIDHVGAETLDVEIRGKRLPCTVTRKPFYKRSGGKL
jgi:aminomethyltransferase